MEIVNIIYKQIKFIFMKISKKGDMNRVVGIILIIIMLVIILSIIIIKAKNVLFDLLG